MTRAPRIAIASLVAFAFATLTSGLAAPPPLEGRVSPRAAAAERTDAVAARGASGFAHALLRRQNAQRRRHGLRRLKVSRDLSRAARRHARDMVRRHYFGHVSRSGSDVVDRVAATPYGRGGRFAVRENLYWWSSKRSPGAVVGSWMGSAVHRANVLGRFRQVGVAAVMRSPYGRRGVTVVGVYGSRSGR